MEQIELSALDRALLRRESVTIKIEVLSKISRGTVLRDITVSKLKNTDQFMIYTTLYEFRQDPQDQTFVGTQQERDAKLEELECPANNARWGRTGRKK